MNSLGVLVIFDVVFFCLIEDFSPFDNQGKRFLYFVLIRVVGNDSSYVFLNNLRKFEKYMFDNLGMNLEMFSPCFIFFLSILIFDVHLQCELFYMHYQQGDHSIV